MEATATRPRADVRVVSASLDRSIDEACARLRTEFPAISPEVIAGSVHEALARTSGAPVDDFRVLLAERSTREALRARCAR